MKIDPTAKKKICPACGRGFSCYPGNCWCNDFPQIMPFKKDGKCLCYDCLKNAMESKIKEYNDRL